MSKEALQKAIDLADGQSSLARRIGAGVKQQHVSLWLKTGVITPKHVIALSRAVAYQVTPHELARDLYPNENDGLPVDKAA